MPQVTFRPGWQPTFPERPRVRMDAVLGTSPPAFSYYYTIPSIGMLMNDTLGDCVIAADGHIVEQQTFFGQRAEVEVTDAEALTGYEVVGGYVVGNPATDKGCAVPSGLAYLQKTGMAGVKIAAYGQVDVSAITKVQTAVSQFGAVDIGMNFPNSAMTQFNDGQVWDVVANDGGNDGGHCVLVCGYDAAYLYVYTWGKVQRMTYAFWDAYVEEAWPVVSTSWVDTYTGVDVEGVDLEALGAEYTAVTGDPSPFPVPVPPATPPPVPVAPPTAADRALSAVAKPWCAEVHTSTAQVALQAALRAWFPTHGL